MIISARRSATSWPRSFVDWQRPLRRVQFSDHPTTMPNITGDGNLTVSHKEFSASPVLPSFSALNIFLSITATLGNALILIALQKVSSICPPRKLFFRCLAVTDLGVGLIVQPFYATFLLSRLTKVSKNVVNALSWIFCAVSLLTLAAISVDRLLALLLGLRYTQVVTLRRVRVVIICFWLIGTSLGSIRWWRKDITFLLASTIMILSLLTSIFCYTRIHLKLRHHVLQEQANGGGIPLHIARFKKTVSSVLWVQMSLVVCYVPFCILVVLNLSGITSDVSLVVTNTLVFLNSSLNPILYCWKIREVKQAVKDTIKQLNLNPNENDTV